MLIYLLWFLLCLIWYFCKEKYHHSAKLLAIYLFALCLFVGFADMLGGYDRYIYAELFDDLADTRNHEGNIFASNLFLLYPRELGYDFLNVLISYVTSNRYIFIFILTAIIYTLLFVSIKDYVDDYPFALILFMGMLYFFSFTYLRQILGVVTAWLSIRHAIKGNFWKFGGILFVAVLMHNSAIIFFPVYFLAKKKLTARTVYMLMLVCLVLGVSGLSDFLFDFYGETSGMQKRAAGYIEDASGFRFDYVLESLVFLFFIMSNYHKISDERRHVLLLNMSLVFCAILLLFVRSLNGGRLGWYYMIGLIYTLTYISTQNRIRSYYKPSIILLSLLLYVRIIWQWGVLIIPYKTFFTSGHRVADFIYDEYEYDSNYDVDKFYR